MRRTYSRRGTHGGYVRQPPISAFTPMRDATASPGRVKPRRRLRSRSSSYVSADFAFIGKSRRLARFPTHAELDKENVDPRLLRTPTSSTKQRLHARLERASAAWHALGTIDAPEAEVDEEGASRQSSVQPSLSASPPPHHASEVHSSDGSSALSAGPSPAPSASPVGHSDASIQGDGLSKVHAPVTPVRGQGSSSVCSASSRLQRLLDSTCATPSAEVAVSYVSTPASSKSAFVLAQESPLPARFKVSPLQQAGDMSTRSQASTLHRAPLRSKSSAGGISTRFQSSPLHAATLSAGAAVSRRRRSKSPPSFSPVSSLACSATFPSSGSDSMASSGHRSTVPRSVHVDSLADHEPAGRNGEAFYLDPLTVRPSKATWHREQLLRRRLWQRHPHAIAPTSLTVAVLPLPQPDPVLGDGAADGSEDDGDPWRWSE